MGRVSRRTVLGALIAVVGSAALPLWPALTQILPERQMEAARAFLYPGRIRPLSLDEVMRPATWVG